MTIKNSKTQIWQEIIKQNSESGDQKFVKKDDNSQENKSDRKTEISEEMKEDERVKDVIKTLQNVIYPKNNQQRNLNKEVGGLEVKKSKNTSSEDIWDDRSEQVDEMGSTEKFNSSAGRSFIWWKKRQKIIQKKLKELAIDALAGLATIKSTTKNSSAKNHISFAEKINKTPENKGFSR